jgi:2-oxoglutarate dehydrogenase E1 component
VLGLEYATIREMLDILKRTYCSTLGVEFMHISNPKRSPGSRSASRVRTRASPSPKWQEGDPAEADRGRRLRESSSTSNTPAPKRFGLDGGESLIPALEQIIKRGGNMGLKDIVFGMAHRGRLNVLTQVMGSRTGPSSTSSRAARIKPTMWKVRAM